MASKPTQKEALAALVAIVENANAEERLADAGEHGFADGIAFALRDAKKALERIDGEKAAGIRQTALERILEATIRAAVMGPARRDRYSRTAGIPWDALEAMRAELDRLGVKWRGMRTALGLRPVQAAPKPKAPEIPKKLDGEENLDYLGAGASVEAYRG